MQNFLRTLLLPVFCLLTISFLVAQTTSLGGRIGVNLATIDSDEDLEGVKSRAGLDIAAVLRLGLSQNLSIQPELHFIQKGYQGDDDDFEADIVLNYLELPVLVRYDVSAGASTNIFFLAGPTFGFGMSGKAKFSFMGVDEEEDIDFGSGEDEVSSTDVGLAFGAGAGFPVGTGEVFFDVRYLLGLSNLDNSDDDEFKVNNRGINIGVGYLIPLN